jgi:hypothetical protein
MNRRFPSALIIALVFACTNYLWAGFIDGGGGGATLPQDLGPTDSPTFVNVTSALTGNASTATALAANPTDCAANQFANTIAASGNLTCAQVAFSNLSGAVSAGQAQEVLGVADLTDFTAKSGSGTTALGATFTSLTTNDTLAWNGSNWVNTAAPIFSGDVTGNHFLAGAGSAAAPSHSFAGDPDTGTYSLIANVFAISAGGALAAYFDSANFVALGETFAIGNGTNAKVHLAGSYGSNPTDPPAGSTQIMVIELGATQVLRIRYNDGGSVKTADISLS